MPLSTEALIKTIREDFHSAHRQDLPRLVELARELGLPGLAEEINQLEAALEAHMVKEEMRVFPMMAAGGSGLLPLLLDDLRADHRRIAALARSLAASIMSLTPVLDTAHQEVACEFIDRSRHFLDELAKHTSFEDEELFPRFDPRTGS